jgi:hypothetical protein
MTPTVSTLPDLLPAVRGLSREDKLRLIHVLAGELVQEANEIPFVPGASYPIWTPLFADDAAAVLQRALDEELKKP